MAKKSNSQIWLEYIPVRILFGILGLLPRSTAIRIGESFGRLAYRLAAGLRRVAHRNLEIAYPEKNEVERDAIARGAFENLGRMLGELAHFPNATRAELEHGIEFEFESEESRNSPEMASIEKQLQGVETTQREVMPMMQRMLETLDRFVQLDVPFLVDELRKRIANLKDMMDRADVTVSEKYRRIVEAYQVEMEYGRTLEAYEGKLGDTDDARAV